MKMQEAIKIRLKNLCYVRSWSFYKLAHISGVHQSSVKNILNDSSKNTGIVTLKKLCDGLGITIREFFDDDIFDNLEQEIG